MNQACMRHDLTENNDLGMKDVSRNADVTQDVMWNECHDACVIVAHVQKGVITVGCDYPHSSGM